MAMVRLRVEVQTVRGWSSPGCEVLAEYVRRKGGKLYAEGLFDQLRKLKCVCFASRRQVCITADLPTNVPFRLAMLILLAEKGHERSWNVRVTTRSIAA